MSWFSGTAILSSPVSRGNMALGIWVVVIVKIMVPFGVLYYNTAPNI